MAFEGLSEKLQGVFKGLKGKGSLTESDINTAMREVKLALLEADVNFKVVKEFVASVKEKSLGKEVLESLTPAQQVIKIVNEELTELMGGTNSKLTYSPKGFTVYMMVGLQGTGKTTTCGKLANYLKKNGKKPMLCACDIYRPAATISSPVDITEILHGMNTGTSDIPAEGMSPISCGLSTVPFFRNTSPSARSSPSSMTFLPGDTESYTAILFSSNFSTYSIITTASAPSGSIPPVGTYTA